MQHAALPGVPFFVERMGEVQRHLWRRDAGEGMARKKNVRCCRATACSSPLCEAAFADVFTLDA